MIDLDQKIAVAVLSGLSIRKAAKTETVEDAPNGNQWFMPNGGELWFFDVNPEPTKALIRDVLEEVKPERNPNGYALGTILVASTGGVTLQEAARWAATDYNRAIDEMEQKIKELGL